MSARRLAVVAFLALALTGPGRGEGPDLPLAEVRPGQRGHGFTVFAGQEPRPFAVEVVGVLRDLAPGTSYLLGRLSGEGLEQTGVIAGMSGSPVYLEGRLAGAVAFAFPFAKEALAGITPIEAMRALAGQPLRGGGGVPVPLSDLVAQRWPSDLLSRALAPLAAARIAPAATRAGLLWGAAGWGPGGRDLLERALGPLASTGSGAPPMPLAPGGAVAALLVEGDLQLAATGTVTDRSGDELLAFGHALFGLGEVSLPLAGAEVVAVVASQASSFKLANVGPVVGAWTTDAAAGTRGVVGQPARQVPLAISIGGPRPRDLSVRLADHPLFTPALGAAALFGGLEAAGEGAAASLDVEAVFRLAGQPPLAVRQSFDGPGAGNDGILWLLALHSWLALNPLERVEVEGIEVRLAPFAQARGATLVGARPRPASARAGGRVEIEVTIAPERGALERQVIPLDLPRDLSPGPYRLVVGDGPSVDAVRFGVEPIEPVRFAAARELLASLASRRELAIAGIVSERGVAAPGGTLPRLPGSVASMRGRAAGRGDERLLRAAVAQHLRVASERPLSGLVRLEIEVLATGRLPGKETP